MKFNKTVLSAYLKHIIYIFLVLMSLTYLFGFYRVALAEIVILIVMMICLFICIGNKPEFKKVYHLVLIVLSLVLMVNGFVHYKLMESVSFMVFAIYHAIMLYILTKK